MWGSDCRQRSGAPRRDEFDSAEGFHTTFRYQNIRRCSICCLPDGSISASAS